jgi:hypothetical protein
MKIQSSSANGIEPGQDVQGLSTEKVYIPD